MTEPTPQKPTIENLIEAITDRNIELETEFPSPGVSAEEYTEDTRQLISHISSLTIERDKAEKKIKELKSVLQEIADLTFSEVAPNSNRVEVIWKLKNLLKK